MSDFEIIGIGIQVNSLTPKQAQYNFHKSCHKCGLNPGCLHISCDQCGIASAHREKMEYFQLLTEADDFLRSRRVK